MGDRRKILMDCDPGIDDALALFLAVAWKEELEILGITTVAGNQTIEKVTENACRLVSFLGEKIEVAHGAVVPMVRELLTSEEVHGETGLGLLELPEAQQQAVGEPAVVFLRDKLMGLEEGEKVTFVATGPLTNLGLLLRIFPEVKERIEQIVLMGGAMCGGNITASAEYNFYEDPEAAKIVLGEGIPVVMCGLDVTRECGLTRNQVEKLRFSKGKACQACSELLDFYFDNERYRECSMVPIHDAVTVMYLVHPEIFEAKPMKVVVDCSEGANRGNTICDDRFWTYDESEHVSVVLEVKKKEFQRIFIEALFELDEVIS